MLYQHCSLIHNTAGYMSYSWYFDLIETVSQSNVVEQLLCTYPAVCWLVLKSTLQSLWICLTRFSALKKFCRCKRNIPLFSITEMKVVLMDGQWWYVLAKIHENWPKVPIQSLSKKILIFKIGNVNGSFLSKDLLVRTHFTKQNSFVSITMWTFLKMLPHADGLLLFLVRL